MKRFRSKAQFTAKGLSFGVLAAFLMLAPFIASLGTARVAEAQTTAPYGTVSANITYRFTDGTAATVGVHSAQVLPSAELTSNTGSGVKTIREVEFKVYVRTPSTADTITSSNVQAVARVKDVSGVFKTIPISNPQGVSSRSGNIWYIYTAVVPASTIDNLIGTVPQGYPFWPTDITFFVSSASTFTGKIGTRTGTFHTPILTTDADVFKMASGGVTPDPDPTPDPNPLICQAGYHPENGVCVADPVVTPDPQPVTPSGKIHSLFEIKMSDGRVVYVDPSDDKTFPQANLFLVGQSGAVGAGVNEVESIKYVVRMQLNNYEQFVIPYNLDFQPNFPSSEHHYDVLIGSTSINKQPDNTPENRSHGSYDLLTLTAFKADIEPQIKTVTSTTQDGQTFKTETATFYLKGYQIKLTNTSGQTYTIPIPEFRSTLSVGQTVVPIPDPDPDECTLGAEGCEPIGDGDGGILGGGQTLGIAVIAVSVIVGGGLFMMKRQGKI